MSRFSLVFGITIVLWSIVVSAQTPNEQPKATDIPLDQIWGYNLPGTRDIAGIPLPETDPQKGVIGRTYEQFKRQREFNIEQLRRTLTTKPPTERASAGFVLPRRPDFFTLQKASTFATAMMRHGAENGGTGSDTFRAGEEMTLVFFSHPASYYVRLEKVERQGKEITVHYQFQPHATVESTVHFALIPLGKLPAGEYHVRFEQMPLEQKHREAGFEPVHPEAFEIVCRPFSFTMWKPAASTPAKQADMIPLDQIWGHNLPGTRDVSELDPKVDLQLLADEIKDKLPGDRDRWLKEELTRRLDCMKISRALGDRPRDGENAGPAFVVIGTGKTALENAASVFVGTKEPLKVLPTDTELSLVFYSYICGRYVWLRSVERSSNEITVRYQFVSHATAEMTNHFALIPLGKLSEGTYEVNIEQLEPINEQGRPVAPMRDPQRLVSDSFSFVAQRK